MLFCRLEKVEDNRTKDDRHPERPEKPRQDDIDDYGYVLYYVLYEM